jgi:hypothetical protein
MKNYLHNFLLLKIPKGNMKAGRFKILSKMRKIDFFEIFEFLLLFISLFNYLECITLLWNF